jgi:NADH-quinone oxidoreductase subunit F
MDETTCMVKALERLSYFYYEESCGQCTPCREGTGWLYRVCTHRARAGRPGGPRLLNSVTDNIMGRTICALGDAAAMPVQSFIKHFRREFEYHHPQEMPGPEDVQRAGSGFFKAAAA